MNANAEQLQAHSGPHFLHWLAACREAFGRQLVDAAAASVQNEGAADGTRT
jgi:hypothetical protein